MNQGTRTRIIQEESSRFLDSHFAGLDLSGSPDFANPITEKFEPCDRDGLSNVDVSGLPSTNHLKQFVNQPDMETLARVAQETGDQQLIERVQDERENTEAKAFMATIQAIIAMITITRPFGDT